MPSMPWHTFISRTFISRTGFILAFDQPTRGGNCLDRVYLSELCYQHTKVVSAAVKSDHKAVILHNGPSLKLLNKTRIVKTYMRSPSQHASFLSFAKTMSYAVNTDNDAQSRV